VACVVEGDSLSLFPGILILCFDKKALSHRQRNAAPAETNGCGWGSSRPWAALLVAGWGGCRPLPPWTPEGVAGRYSHVLAKLSLEEEE